jgi:FtsZ-binding cell division protein ZapB
MNEELSSALAELREERRIGARLQSDVQTYRSEIQRLTTSIDQSKTKEIHLFEEVGQLKNAYEALNDENERLRSEVKYKNTMYVHSYPASTDLMPTS